MPDFELEKAAVQRGFRYVCGIDEAGRGPLAGPVCAAAVVLPDGIVIEGLNDSKKLSEKKREALFDIIIEKALGYSIAFGSLAEIEEFNILGATLMAMAKAVNGLPTPADFCLIDGNQVPKEIKIPCETVIKGDSKSCSIAAASILAKVTRDRLMLTYHEKYPQYAFDKHKGYGTKEHIENILKYGPCELHRPSFLTKIYGKK